MKTYFDLNKRLLTLLIALLLAASFAACDTNTGLPKPEGTFICTQVDYGEGLNPRISTSDEDELLIFNPDGTGLWKLGFEMDFKWKLKDDKLTITRSLMGKKEVFEAIWDGEKILLDYDGTPCLYEKQFLLTQPVQKDSFQAFKLLS